MGVVINSIYLAIIPMAMNNFADKLISRITVHIETEGTRKRKTSTQSTEKPQGEEEHNEEGELIVHNIYCNKVSNNMILCNIEGENIQLEHIKKTLVFLGFRVYESSGIITGENNGSIWAEEFLSKKMKVRAIISSGRNNVKIFFKTSIWTPFSYKDCSIAAKMLEDILSTL